MIDLHLHLDGSLSVANAKELAALQDIKIPDNDEEIKKLLSVDDDCKNLNDFLQKFDFPCSLLQTKKALTLATKNLLNELAGMGLLYAEVRFAPQLHTNKGISQEDAICAVIEGVNEACIPANVIICMMRGAKHEVNEESVILAKKYLDKGVCAIDLAGAEAVYKTKEYEDLFALAQKNNIPITIHAGEADGPQSIYDAISFGACRIGHGVRCLEDEKLVSLLAKEQIPLECCPTSNVLTCIFDNISQFPLQKLLDLGLKVTINSDDMAVCNTSLVQEYKKLEDTFGLSLKDKKMLMLNAVDASFANDKLKEELRIKIANY